jgi:hypothetical protein
MNKVIRRLLTLAACAATLAQLGCAGYQMGSIKPSAYADIQTISVPTFKNLTLEPRVAVLVTNSVSKQIQMDGTFKIASKGRADAELRGEIDRIERQQLRSSTVNNFKSTELMSFMVIRWALYDPVTGEKLAYSQATEDDENAADASGDLVARPGRIIGRTIVFVDPNLQTGERGALAAAAQKAAEQLVSQLAEGW